MCQVHLGTLLRTAALGTASQDSSEELLQRRKEGARICVNFFAEKNMQSSTKRLLLLTKNKQLELMILVLFYVQEDAGIWAH